VGIVFSSLTSAEQAGGFSYQGREELGASRIGSDQRLDFRAQAGIVFARFVEKALPLRWREVCRRKK
jgi:hypothetical protein